MTYELMFKAYEHVFTTYELMFTSYEHRFVGVEKEKCTRKKRKLCEEEKLNNNYIFWGDYLLPGAIFSNNNYKQLPTIIPIRFLDKKRNRLQMLEVCFFQLGYPGSNQE